ncbi:autoinducer binding domain-containing protein [Ancylobacter oerskovii]|uniref:Autoinducer binding domain-containing protein n=1 Tax=Ancylobacter oerskovii TaxID=459519 RepID=A0ABW4Z571_9HYPH|nr:autoinducer binding domain-containing protein [Ancylobacter oerskovii]MBS7546450.1 autoinducer binding domain-containing protein [Ancylobacter oerskovii]
MDAALQSLIDAIDVAQDERSIANILRGYAQTCGFERFAYLQTAAAGITTYNNYPREWQSLYLERGYSEIDPVVTTARRHMGMFSWSAEESSGRFRPKAQRQFYSEAVDHGIRAGLSVPVPGTFGTMLMLTLATSHARVSPSMFSDAQRAAHATLAVHYRLKALAETPLAAPPFSLTPKELLCLKWASKGKYMPEIATLIDVQHRTVQHYLDNARAKLNATNLTHAVAIALERGLISPD